jgi:hypothetical protein
MSPHQPAGPVSRSDFAQSPAGIQGESECGDATLLLTSHQRARLHEAANFGKHSEASQSAAALPFPLG